MVSKLAKMAAFVSVMGITHAAPSIAAEKLFNSSSNLTAKYAREMGATLPPKGWVEFCRGAPENCRGGVGSRIRVKLDKQRWRELDDVNAYVNNAIEPATDLEVHNLEEHWAIPEERGDCEDYVLLKRQHLMSLGWPREALLITVVLDEEKEGHAVLTVITDKGEFVLDNQNRQVLSWTGTNYQFIKRQAQVNPALWVALDPLASRRLRKTSSENRMGEGR
ncbi:MAG: transglutaminase-like cysteine peptidase [Hyphomicrobiales bacterium]